MRDYLLLKGVILGFSIAAPVGPIGVLCIRRTLTDGQLLGLVSGLGAATADAVYGAVAGFGLTIIAGLLVQHQVWLRLIGGAFLCFMGIKTLLSPPVPLGTSNQKLNLVGAYTSTFILTLTNPMTILSFAAILASAGVGSAPGDYSKAIILITGVFSGSALWWMLLSTGIGLFRSKFNPTGLLWVNRISGAVITLFGANTIIKSIL